MPGRTGAGEDERERMLDRGGRVRRLDRVTERPLECMPEPVRSRPAAEDDDDVLDGARSRRGVREIVGVSWRRGGVRELGRRCELGRGCELARQRRGLGLRGRRDTVAT